MSGQRVGYVRVSTLDQNPARQLEGMTLDRVFSESASARNADRPELIEMMAYVRAGDTLYVHSIDRLARNLDDLRSIVRELVDKGARVEFVTEGLTFTADASPIATMLLSVMGALAEFERAIIRERQAEGIALARNRGAYRGRKNKLGTERLRQARELLEGEGNTMTSVAETLGVDRSTLHRALKRTAAP